MKSFEILTGICVIFVHVYTASSRGMNDGCVTLMCPWNGERVCSFYNVQTYKVVNKSQRCNDQDESHEHHGWGHERGGNSHESGGNYGSSSDVYYTVSYENTKRMLTVTVRNRCQITLRVCKGTPTMPSSKPESTKGTFPPMITSHGSSLMSYNKSTPKGQTVITSTTRRTSTSVLTSKKTQESTSIFKAPQITEKSTTHTVIPTTNNVQVTTRSTKLPMRTIITSKTTRSTKLPMRTIISSKSPQTVAPSTQRPQVTTMTSIRTQSTRTAQSMQSVTQQYSSRPSTPINKEQDVIKITTQFPDIPSVRPKTTPVSQSSPFGEPSDAEHVKQELRTHEDQQYGLMIGVPVGLVGITALILAIICLCRRGTSCCKEEKNTSEKSKGLSSIYEDKVLKSDLPPSYYNPVYGELMKGQSIRKGLTPPDKQNRGRTMESFAEKSPGSDRIYEEIQSVRLSVHLPMSSTNSDLKNSKETRRCGEPPRSENVSNHPASWYQDMKGIEYKYMCGNIHVKM